MKIGKLLYPAPHHPRQIVGAGTASWVMEAPGLEKEKKNARKKTMNIWFLVLIIGSYCRVSNTKLMCTCDPGGAHISKHTQESALDCVLLSVQWIQY